LSLLSAAAAPRHGGGARSGWALETPCAREKRLASAGLLAVVGVAVLGITAAGLWVPIPGFVQRLAVDLVPPVAISVHPHASQQLAITGTPAEDATVSAHAKSTSRHPVSPSSATPPPHARHVVSHPARARSKPTRLAIVGHTGRSRVATPAASAPRSTTPVVVERTSTPTGSTRTTDGAGDESPTGTAGESAGATPTVAATDNGSRGSGGSKSPDAGGSSTVVSTSGSTSSGKGSGPSAGDDSDSSGPGSSGSSSGSDSGSSGSGNSGSSNVGGNSGSTGSGSGESESSNAGGNSGSTGSGNSGGSNAGGNSGSGSGNSGSSHGGGNTADTKSSGTS
jgi:hypothetical protein